MTLPERIAAAEARFTASVVRLGKAEDACEKIMDAMSAADHAYFDAKDAWINARLALDALKGPSP